MSDMTTPPPLSASGKIRGIGLRVEYEQPDGPDGQTLAYVTTTASMLNGPDVLVQRELLGVYESIEAVLPVVTWRNLPEGIVSGDVDPIAEVYEDPTTGAPRDLEITGEGLRRELLTELVTGDPQSAMITLADLGLVQYTQIPGYYEGEPEEMTCDGCDPVEGCTNPDSYDEERRSCEIVGDGSGRALPDAPSSGEVDER